MNLVVLVVDSAVALALLILFIITCVSVIRLSAYFRSGGRKYAIDVDDEDDDFDEDDEDDTPPRMSRRGRGA